MIKSARARHEAGMRFAITTGSSHALAIDDADGDSARRPSQRRSTPPWGVSPAGPAEIHHGYVVSRGDGRPDESGEVVVTGPVEDPDALGERWLAAVAAPAGAAR